MYANGKRIAWLGKNVGEAAYYLGDHLGSVGVVVASDGSVIDKYRYGPWGDDRGSMVTFANAFTYTGKEQDEELGVDWLYYGARYYDPNLRLFTQPDRLYDLSPGFGSYVYTNDNPLRFIDPTGGYTIESGYKDIWYGRNNYGGTQFVYYPSFTSRLDRVFQSTVSLTPWLGFGLLFSLAMDSKDENNVSVGELVDIGVSAIEHSGEVSPNNALLAGARRFARRINLIEAVGKAVLSNADPGWLIDAWNKKFNKRGKKTIFYSASAVEHELQTLIREHAAEERRLAEEKQKHRDSGIEQDDDGLWDVDE